MLHPRTRPPYRRQSRWSFGPVEFPPPLPPGAVETAGQTAHRKASVRHSGKLIFDLLFQLMGSHLGKFEAGQLLSRWARELGGALARGKGYSARGRKPDTIEDDYLLEVTESFGGSPRDAARFVRARWGDELGPSELAIEERIARLLRKINSVK
jgi:hypothetical protein